MPDRHSWFLLLIFSIDRYYRFCWFLGGFWGSPAGHVSPAITYRRLKFFWQFLFWFNAHHHPIDAHLFCFPKIDIDRSVSIDQSRFLCFFACYMSPTISHWRFVVSWQTFFLFNTPCHPIDAYLFCFSKFDIGRSIYWLLIIDFSDF